VQAARVRRLGPSVSMQRGRERDVSYTTKTSLLRVSLDAAKVHYGANSQFGLRGGCWKTVFCCKKERLIQPVHANLARTRFEKCVHPFI